MPLWNGSTDLTIAQVETASEAGATAAITAAGLPDATEVQAACDAALVAYGVATEATLDAVATAVSNLGDIIPDASTIALNVATAAVVTPRVTGDLLRATVTISGAPTSGTVLASSGGTQRIIWAVLVSCSAAQSSFSLASTGGDTMGTHQILQNGNLSLSLPFGAVFKGGTGNSVTANKTTGATLVIDVWYSDYAP